MKFSAATILAAAAALASPAFAQSNGTDYATGLVAALNGAGLTSLATALGAFPDIATTLGGGASAGMNFTVFGPSNEALAPLLADPTALNLTQIQETLMCVCPSSSLRPSHGLADTFPHNRARQVPCRTWIGQG